ncbi:MAG: hypothetical protein AAGU23_10400 [Bacillota bacterium]
MLFVQQQALPFERQFGRVFTEPAADTITICKPGMSARISRWKNRSLCRR